ncbi:MAG TPA: DUF4397 domain-containing protein [Kineosporiaceae bacterium]
MSSRSGRLAIRTVSVGLLLLASAVGTASLASAAPTSQVYIVQAIAGSTVDVLVDSSVVQAAVAPKTVVGPLNLSVGQHVIQVRSGSTTLVSARFTVAGKDSLDVVAHRAADAPMSPVVTVFRNDTSSVGPGKTRLVVSHVAVAEPADIRVDGQPFFRNVANGESLSLVVPARAYSLDVVATANAGRTILAPVQVTLEPGTLTRIFAFGSPAEKTADAIVQVFPVPVVGAGRPTSVHTGDGGQAADSIVTSRSVPWLVVAAAIAVLGLAGLAGAVLGSVRSAQTTARAAVPPAAEPVIAHLAGGRSVR